MSARVYNPTIFTELTKLRSPASLRRQLPSPSVAKVKRDLFGPVDKEDSRRFLEKELALQNEKSCKKWGFDFSAGQPLPDHQQYVWERVLPLPQPLSPCTGMITLTRVAHAVQRPTDSDNLLDRRAEQANRQLPFLDDEDANNASSSSVLLSPRSIEDSDMKTYPTMPSAAKLKNYSSISATRMKRQQRITDYLTERKRLSPYSPKHSPSKKARTSTVGSSGMAGKSTL